MVEDSMPSDSLSPSRRRHERTATRVTVRWHNRDQEGVSAQIHDVSAEGLFIVPVGLLPAALRAGDPVWVVVRTPTGEEETLTGTVRWHGFHPKHNVPGCGVLLDASSIAAMRRVLPIASRP
jgi:hypothetical protein